MSDTQRAKRHHLVPEWYLLGWADAREQITAIDLSRPDRTFRCHVRNAMVRSNFFTVEASSGPSDRIETDYLAKLDGAAHKAVEAIVAGEWPLPDEPRMALARFLGVQLFRSQGSRDRRNRAITELSQKAAKMMMVQAGALERHLLDALGHQPSDEEKHAYAAGLANISVEEHPNAFVNYFGIGEELALPICDMRWKVLESSELEFITCDRPLMLVPRRDKQRWRGVGVLTADHLAIPLTSTLLLKCQSVSPATAVPPRSSAPHQRANALGVRAYNELVVAQAEHTIAMRSGDQWPLPTREQVLEAFRAS